MQGTVGIRHLDVDNIRSLCPWNGRRIQDIPNLYPYQQNSPHHPRMSAMEEEGLAAQLRKKADMHRGNREGSIFTSTIPGHTLRDAQIRWALACGAQSQGFGHVCANFTFQDGVPVINGKPTPPSGFMAKLDTKDALISLSECALEQSPLAQVHLEPGALAVHMPILWPLRFSTSLHEDSAASSVSTSILGCASGDVPGRLAVSQPRSPLSVTIHRGGYIYPGEVGLLDQPGEINSSATATFGVPGHRDIFGENDVHLPSKETPEAAAREQAHRSEWFSHHSRVEISDRINEGCQESYPSGPAIPEDFSSSSILLWSVIPVHQQPCWTSMLRQTFGGGCL